jgi:hypothetical protein
VLELFDRNFTIYGLPVTAETKADYCVVRAGKMNLAPGYPYDTCVMLAEHLQDHWAAALGLKEPAAVPHVIDGTQHAGTEDDVWPDEFIVQPPKSAIQIADSAEHLTLRIPPAGLNRDAKFALMHCLSLAVVAALLTAVAVTERAFRAPGAGFFGMLLINLWAVIMIWMLLIINRMHRQAAIAVAGNRLMIITKNIFRRKKHEWRRDEVRAVVAASAGPSPDHKPRIDLQIRTANDKTIRLFTGRPADELQWLAAVIRRKLFISVPCAAPAEVPKSQPRMVLESLAD